MEAATGSNVQRERELESTPAAAGLARALVREALVGDPIDEALLGDAQLAVSELVTNAVVHGDGGPITVRIETSPTAIACVVTSGRTGRLLGDPATWTANVATGPTGRGLAIVRTVADIVTVDVEDSAVTVRCTFARR